MYLLTLLITIAACVRTQAAGYRYIRTHLLPPFQPLRPSGVVKSSQSQNVHHAATCIASVMEYLSSSSARRLFHTTLSVNWHRSRSPPVKSRMQKRRGGGVRRVTLRVCKLALENMHAHAWRSACHSQRGIREREQAPERASVSATSQATSLPIVQ